MLERRACHHKDQILKEMIKSTSLQFIAVINFKLQDSLIRSRISQIRRALNKIDLDLHTQPKQTNTTPLEITARNQTWPQCSSSDPLRNRRCQS